MTRYLKWYEEGHLSSNGICFDIGIGTRKSVLKFKETGECFPGDDIDRAGQIQLSILENNSVINSKYRERIYNETCTCSVIFFCRA